MYMYACMCVHIVCLHKKVFNNGQIYFQVQVLLFYMKEQMGAYIDK
jgi:hypothetical protein